MNLIDYFNAFHLRAQEIELTANARSLYIAILGEFNRFGYPPQLKLANAYLQHLSSINSTHSFDSARNLLEKHEFINYKKPVYELVAKKAEIFQIIPGNAKANLTENDGKSAEIFGKEKGNFSEIFGKEKGNFSEISCITHTQEEKEKEKNKDKNKEEEARARDSPLTRNSAEVLETWEKYRGEKLIFGRAYGLIELEKNYGAEKVIQAIKRASESNNYDKFPFVTYNYFKKFLEDKEEKKQVKSEKWEGDTEWLKEGNE